MNKILLNYNYDQYPFTTASYFEDALKNFADVAVYRVGEIDAKDVDLIINIMPCDQIVLWPGVKNCYYEIDCHLVLGRKKDLYQAVDTVFIAQNEFISLYPPKKTVYLPLGCEPTKHRRFEKERQIYDIGFIGNDTYPRRRTLLEQLDLKYKVFRGSSKPGLPYSQALSRCKLTFNCSLDRDVNMRFFESISIGRLLLTDYLPEQDKFARRGEHYDTFENWSELDAKVQYYLSHEKERERKAFTGSLYIQRHSNYQLRSEKLLECAL